MNNGEKLYLEVRPFSENTVSTSSQLFRACRSYWTIFKTQPLGHMLVKPRVWIRANDHAELRVAMWKAWKILAIELKYCTVNRIKSLDPNSPKDADGVEYWGVSR